MFTRKINVFEKMLLPVGIGLTFFGFYLILLAEKVDTDIAWLRLVTVFLWMLLLFIVIMTATTEDMKEELGAIQHEHITEVKILKEIMHDQLQEIKLMRQELKVKK
jgi:hypothetical protein